MISGNIETILGLINENTIEIVYAMGMIIVR
jgi:hypothetical protein